VSDTYRLSDGVEITATVRGDGPGLLLTHGWPHSRAVWSSVIDELAGEFTVVAPDLPGIGGSTAPAAYDADAIARSFDALCGTVGLSDYAVMAIDAAVAPATMLALTSPHRVRRAVLMEGLLPGVPGAEDFLAGGPPWWFGFHSVPGFAERVLAGHEAEYVGFFLDNGTVHGIDDSTRAAMIAAHTGTERLAHGLEYYRALALSAEQFATASRTTRLTVPALVLGSAPVGDALARQVNTLGDHVTSHQLDDCGHIIPLDAPRRLLDVAAPFLRGRM
jgi:pimeloyl-ACP methyl ester carboxylesterase